MERLSAIEGLVIRQQKEWGEILTGFETKNKYIISDVIGNRLFLAEEESGSLLLRWFLRALRPFTINVLAENGRAILRVRRPFRFYFHRVEIFNARGQLLGAVERRFSILRRIYSVFNKSGEEIFQLFGPLFHPWTFHIKNGEMEHGKITKKWSGLLKEGLTDADNFGVMFPARWETELKALFLGAVFLIDFVHFENKGNN